MIKPFKYSFVRFRKGVRLKNFFSIYFRLRMDPTQVKQALEVISSTCFGFDLGNRQWEPFQTLNLLGGLYNKLPVEEEGEPTHARGPTLYLNCPDISKGSHFSYAF